MEVLIIATITKMKKLFITSEKIFKILRFSRFLIHKIEHIKENRIQKTFIVKPL